jgi:hypothetical protein
VRPQCCKKRERERETEKERKSKAESQSCQLNIPQPCPDRVISLAPPEVSSGHSWVTQIYGVFHAGNSFIWEASKGPLGLGKRAKPQSGRPSSRKSLTTLWHASWPGPLVWPVGLMDGASVGPLCFLPLPGSPRGLDLILSLPPTFGFADFSSLWSP